MPVNEVSLPGKNIRKFLPESIVIDSWKSIETFFENLVSRPLLSEDDLQRWLADYSELNAVVQEHAGWLYIRMTCDTQDKKATDAYVFFVNEIQPQIAPYHDRLNKKLVECSFSNGLDSRYAIFLKQVENEIKIFRQENIPLHAELSVKEQKYGELAGAMTVDEDGKTLTLQQAANILKDPDRTKRDSVYHKIKDRRLQDRNVLDDLFSELVRIRQQVALNAGFSNYRDYKFISLNRFDYSPSDCFSFHDSVQRAVVPVLNELTSLRKKELQLAELKPWDMDVDTSGKPDLKPFSKGEELMEKTIRCFQNIHPYFGEVMETLKKMKYVDLDSRIGKAPGGYNYPLYETGVPFIFMNASGSLRDVITMVHEGGHAIHSMLTRDLDFIGFKDLPSEIAELASMSMELISMEHWNYFFTDPDELRRAKREQLENIIEALPWIACVDKFQHWIYEHPQHTIAERTEAWTSVYRSFSSDIVDWRGEEDAMAASWQKQLHLFEVPFYYIEYGMAQLGAIAVWRNYKQNPEQAVKGYIQALKSGYTQSISATYALAGIRFDFSENYIRELIRFVKDELEKV
ncbi:MAG: M3 family oligoendopeptidase [Bacteroidetes bacterium]|nr:M3 family oligoendopeptidase [Bacteroidota bacterium]